MKLFEIDSPVVQFLTKMADLMWLNVLTLICCVPIFTIGASLTAMNYMALKMVRNEESYITKGFFKAFKENFKQATAIWMVFFFVIAVLAGDFYIITTTETKVNTIVRLLIIMIGVVVAFTFVFVFPVQAKFINPVRRTIWNAFALSVVQFPKAFLMIVLYLVPYGILYVSGGGLLPVVFVFGLSLPAYLSAKLYNRFFMSLEQEILEESGANQKKEQDPDAEAPIFMDMPEDVSDKGKNKLVNITKKKG